MAELGQGWLCRKGHDDGRIKQRNSGRIRKERSVRRTGGGAVLFWCGREPAGTRSSRCKIRSCTCANRISSVFPVAAAGTPHSGSRYEKSWR